MIICPCCGYKISEKRKPLKKPRRRRLPNGFGSITELKGRRLNKPFFVRVTVGKDLNGKPVLKSLSPTAYFKTYNEAYMALIKYNENPYDLDNNITVKELFDKWTEQVMEERSSSHIEYITSAFAYCTSMYDMKVRDIRARHIKYCIENGSVLERKGPNKGKPKLPSPNTKDRIKMVWNNMLDYALEYEIVDRNYARTFTLSKKVYEEARKNRREHVPFSQEELAQLWSLYEKEPVAKLMLVQCYTGLRPNELCKMIRGDVDLANRTLIGGSKTEAGKDRVIPIHSAILPLVKSYYKQSQELNAPKLFITTDSRNNNKIKCWNYRRYSLSFHEFIEKYHFNPNHRPHDPRKTFVTEAKRYGVDDNVIKILVGHTITDITESIYTQRDIEWLRADLEKIKV